MKAYKGFNKDMTCKGFQYEEGKEYEAERAEVCEEGFHACEMPLDVFKYYAPASSVYHEVEQDVEISKSDDDSKVASTKIKIGARLNIAGLVKAQIEYVKERVNKSVEAGDSEAVSGGDRSAVSGGDGSAVSGRGTTEIGKHGVCVCKSETPKARGKMGAVVVLAQESILNYASFLGKHFRLTESNTSRMCGTPSKTVRS